MRWRLVYQSLTSFFNKSVTTLIGSLLEVVIVTKLQAERLRRGMNQTALAAAAGKLSASDISRFERGYGRPYPAQAARLAHVLGLSASELLEPAEEPQHAA